MLSQEAKEYKAFLQALERNPTDEAMHKVFADWLDEHDEPEEADKQRKWSLEKYEAQERIVRFATRYADGDTEGMVEGLLRGQYCFSSDYGPENARDDDQLWEDIQLVTETKIDVESHIEQSRFNCAC